MADIVVTISGRDENLERLIQKLVASLNQLNAAGAKSGAGLAGSVARQKQVLDQYSGALRGQVRELQRMANAQAAAAEQEARLPKLREQIAKSVAAAEKERQRDVANAAKQAAKEAAQAERERIQAEFRFARESRQGLQQRAAGEIRASREADQALRQRAQGELRAVRESDQALKARAAGELRAIREREQAERASARRLASEQRQAQQQISRENARLAGATAAITAAAIAAAAIAVDKLVQGLTAAVRMGIEFNATIETASVGMAGILSVQGEISDASGRVLEGQEKFNAALAISNDLVEQLRIKATGFGLPFQPVLQGLQAIQGPLTRAGLTLDEIVDLAPKLALGLRAADIPMREIAQETRAILNGTITRNDRLNQILGITKKEIDQAKATGTVYELLNAKLAGFTAAGTALANTYRGVFERLTSAGQILAGRITEPLFESTKAAGNVLVEGLLDAERGQVQDELKGLVGVGQEVFARLGAMAVSFSRKLVAGLQEASGWLEENKQQVLEVLQGFALVARMIGQAVGFLFRMGVETTSVLVKTGALAGALKFVATALFVQITMWKVIKIAIETVGLGIMTIVLGPVAALLKALGEVANALGMEGIGGALTGAASDLFGKMQDQALAVNDTFKDITESAEGFLKALNEPVKPIEIPVKPKLDASDFTFTPNKPPPEEGDEKDLTKRKEMLSRYFEERFDLQTAFLRATGQAEEAHLRDLQAQYRDFVQTALKIGDFAGVLLVNKLINVEQLRFRINQAQDEVGRLGNEINDKISLIERQRQAGIVTPNFASEETKRLIAQLSAEYEHLADTMERANEEFNDPEVTAEIARLRREVQRMAIDVQEMDDIFFNLRDNLQGPLEQAFTSFADNLISRNRSILQSFGDLAKGIVLELAKVIRQMLITAAVKKLLDETFSSGLFGGGLTGAVVGSVSGAGPGEFAEGVTRLRGPGTDRSDSIPAWLSRDESVIPAKAARFYGYDFMDALIGMRMRPDVARMALRAPGYADGVSRVLDQGVPHGRPRAEAERLELLVRPDEGLIVDSMSGTEGERWFLRMASKHRRALGKLAPRTGR